MSKPPEPEFRKRAVRVFVSSTFRDMAGERDELCKRTFFELRKLCEDRGVTFTDVDLRWGITDEQKSEGKVLPICLDEIHRCSYFIGLLGERYGWIPGEIPADLIERQPWLDEHRHRSVTELEILHGVLHNPEMAEHAFFYFRDPAFIDTLPASEQIRCREVPTAEEIRELGQNEARQRCEERRLKLRTLKDAIRGNAFPVRQYRDPEELGKLVLEDLKGVIERLYPEASAPGSLEREAAHHEAVAERLRRIFVGREKYFEQLDRHVLGNGPPLVVLGAAGVGKSALLANWSARYRQEHPSKPVILHFIGASPQSTDWSAMLRRILSEISARLNVALEVPEKPDELRGSFGAALCRAAEAGRVVLLIDDLSGLEDRDLALDLVWLPKEIPENVRLILSTMPGRPLDEVTRRGWPSLQVEPLEREERRRLTTEYLGQYSKTLGKEHLEQVTRRPQAGNPLYTRALLEELRLCGDHDTLGRRLREYLAAGSAAELFDKILERYETDYQRERPRLVRDAMCVLWAARRGLSEPELLEMLKIGEERLPQAHWAPLYLAIEPLLMDRSGLLTFSHEFLRRVVEKRYLSSKEERQRIHRYLAYWFGRLRVGPRKLEELPWHLLQAESWEELSKLFADPEFLHAACAEDRGSVKSYLAAIERRSNLALPEVYRAVLEDPLADPRLTWEVASLLGDLGYSQVAAQLTQALTEFYRETDKVPHREASFEAIRQRLDQKVARGEFAGMDPFAEMQRDFERLQAKLLLKASLGNRAAALISSGELGQAMELLKEEERICREVGEETWLIGNLVNQGIVLEDQGDLEGALGCYREQEVIARRAGEKEGLADALSGQGRVHRARGENDRALALLEEEERIRREIADAEGLRQCLGTHAILLDHEGRLDEALTLHREVEQSYQETGDPEGLVTSLENQASILLRLDRLEEALRTYEKEEQICRRYGLQRDLTAALGGRAAVLHSRGRRDEALALEKEREKLCRDLGIPTGLVESLVHQAALCIQQPGGLKDCKAALAEVAELVKRHKLSAVVKRLKPMLDFIREKAKSLEGK